MSIIRFCKVWQISTKEPTLRAEADSVMPEGGPKSPDSPNPVSYGALPSGEVVFWAHAVRSGWGAVLLGGRRFTGLGESGDFVGFGAECLHDRASSTRTKAFGLRASLSRRRFVLSSSGKRSMKPP